MLFFMAFLMVIVWGSAFTLVSIGVKYISPLWLVTYRLIIGAILVIIYVKFKGLNLPNIRDKRWIWYFAMGLIGMVIPFFLLSTGQVIIDSGLTAIMVGTMPLMTVILAHFFTNEKLSITKIIGFIFGFIGIVILFLPSDFSIEINRKLVFTTDNYYCCILLCSNYDYSQKGTRHTRHCRGLYDVNMRRYCMLIRSFINWLSL